MLFKLEINTVIFVLTSFCLTSSYNNGNENLYCTATARLGESEGILACSPVSVNRVNV